MVVYSDDFTRCRQCGRHWFSVVSRDVSDISYDKLRSGVLFAVHDDRQYSRYGEVKYSLKHTSVSCDGEIRLGVVGLSSRSKERYLRWSYGDVFEEFDETRVQELMSEVFGDVPPDACVATVGLGQVCGVLLYRWNIHRSRQYFRRKLDFHSARRVEDVLAGNESAAACANLITVDGYWEC
jgi:hypothetical protein